jgi:arginase family enzyme
LVRADDPPPSNAKHYRNIQAWIRTVSARAGAIGRHSDLSRRRSFVLGTRSIDPLEKQLVRERSVAVADMRQIDEFGVGVLIRRVIDRVKGRNGVLHVSFDVDFLDPALARRRRVARR